MPQPLDHKQQQHEKLSKEVASAGEQFEHIQAIVLKERAGFFERLALLSGGSIALSLTFLGYLQSNAHSTVSYRETLYAAWGFLLLCLITALLRNIQHQDYHFFSAAYPYFQKRADFVLHETSVVNDKTYLFLTPDNTPMDIGKRQTFAEELSTKAKRLNAEAARSRKRAKIALIIWRACEYTAQLSFLAGIVLLVIFAVLNTPRD
jgi:hypothetical protein